MKTARASFRLPLAQRPVDRLDDRGDKDILGDGCIKIGTINDQSSSLAGGGGAESTGRVLMPRQALLRRLSTLSVSARRASTALATLTGTFSRSTARAREQIKRLQRQSLAAKDRPPAARFLISRVSLVLQSGISLDQGAEECGTCACSAVAMHEFFHSGGAGLSY